MLVYNGTNTAWEEVQSIGNFYNSTFSEAFDGSRTQFTLSNAPTSVQQIILSLNGVVQKPGTAFTLSSSTVTLASAPAAGTDYFAVVMGSAVNIGTPSNNTVTTAILQNASVTTAKIADDAVTNAKIGAGAVGSTEIATNAVTSDKINTGQVTTAKLGDLAVSTAKLGDQAVTLAKLEHGTSSNDGKFLRANNGADPTFETVDFTNLNASNLTSGTIPDARFPATLPVADGSNLTGLASTVANGCIYENSKTISSNFSTSTTKNSMSAGPITIGAGVTLTIPSGSFYTIV